MHSLRYLRTHEMGKGCDYKADLLADLRNDPDYSAEYVAAAKRDSKEAFLIALRDIADARLGLTRGCAPA